MTTAAAGMGSVVSVVNAGTGTRMVTSFIPRTVLDMLSSRPRADGTLPVGFSSQARNRNIRPRCRPTDSPLLSLRVLLSRVRRRMRPRVQGRARQLPPHAAVAECRRCRSPRASLFPWLLQSLVTALGTQLRHRPRRIGHRFQPCCSQRIGYGTFWGRLASMAHGLEDPHLAL